MWVHVYSQKPANMYLSEVVLSLNGYAYILDALRSRLNDTQVNHKTSDTYADDANFLLVAKEDFLYVIKRVQREWVTVSTIEVNPTEGPRNEVSNPAFKSEMSRLFREVQNVLEQN